MKEHCQIEAWAHMLDESFNKDASKDTMSPLPKDENTKFNVDDVFTEDLDDEQIEQLFNAIWPDWFEYFTNEVEKQDDVEVYGRQRDVDDWDVWKISVKDCYGDADGMAERMIEHIPEEWHGKTVTLKEIIDDEVRAFAENAADVVDIDTIEQYGTCTYRGRKRYGGYYPEH